MSWDSEFSLRCDTMQTEHFDTQKEALLDPSEINKHPVRIGCGKLPDGFEGLICTEENHVKSSCPITVVLEILYSDIFSMKWLQQKKRCKAGKTQFQTTGSTGQLILDEDGV